MIDIVDLQKAKIREGQSACLGFSKYSVVAHVKQRRQSTAISGVLLKNG